MSKAADKPLDGHRVVHRALDDDNSGTAKTGIVVEPPVGDSDQSLVIAQFDDSDHPEAFDRRELIDIGPASYTRGVVMLYPRHLLAMLKKGSVISACVLAIALGIGLNLAKQYWHWPTQTIVLVGLGSLLLVCVVAGFIEYKVSQKDHQAKAEAQSA